MLIRFCFSPSSLGFWFPPCPFFSGALVSCVHCTVKFSLNRSLMHAPLYLQKVQSLVHVLDVLERLPIQVNPRLLLGLLHYSRLAGPQTGVPFLADRFVSWGWPAADLESLRGNNSCENIVPQMPVISKCTNLIEYSSFMWVGLWRTLFPFHYIQLRIILLLRTPIPRCYSLTTAWSSTPWYSISSS